MKDLGTKHHSMGVEVKADSKHYPGVTIDHRAGLKLKNKKVGHKGHMKVKYHVTGQQSYRDGSGHTNIDLTHAEELENEKE